MAADPAVVAIALDGLAAASRLSGRPRPWLMVSLNDGEDPHFRKARFDPALCPPECDRPCERICPADAIDGQVIDARCYGCGRCLPICPLGLIEAEHHQHRPAELLPQLLALGIEALEIHTQIDRDGDFAASLAQLKPWLGQLQLLAISCPEGPGAIAYLQRLAPQVQGLTPHLLWQADGRPMSGDIGAGTTLASVRYAGQVLEQGLPGHVQLAGGTNAYTVAKLRQTGLLGRVAGIGFGSCARTNLSALLEALEHRGGLLEDHPDLLNDAVRRAGELVTPLKTATSAP